MSAIGVAVKVGQAIPAAARSLAAKYVFMSEDEMTLTASSRTAMLDELASVVTHFSLHTSDPGDTGVSEMSGGGYGRVATAWASAAGLSVTNGPSTFTIPAGTPTHVGFWSASSGGTFYGSATLASPQVRFAGSFTVPQVTVFMNAGDVTVVSGVSSDELRLVLHDSGLLQAPLHVDPDTDAFSVLGDYDAEQGGFPLDLPATTTSKALAVTPGTNKSSMWFGARADGTETMWLDQTSAYATVTATVPALTSSTVWTIEGRSTATEARRLWQTNAIGSPRSYVLGGDIYYWDGANGYGSASTIDSLLGIDSESEEFYWRLAVNGTSYDYDVSLDGIVWVDAVAGVASASVSLSGASLFWGSNTVGGHRGRCYYLRVRDGGVDAPVVAHFTPGLFPAGSRSNGSTGVDSHGVTWTLTKPTAVSSDEPAVVLPGARRFVLPGVSGEYLSTPDTAALSITGDIDIRVQMSAVSWDGIFRTLASKWNDLDSSWLMRLSNTSRLQFLWTENGSTVKSVTSTVGVGSPVGMRHVRAAVDADTGSGDGLVTFYLSTVEAPGPGDWVQLGSAVAVVGGVTIWDSAAPLVVGAHSLGLGNPADIDVVSAEVRNGIDGTLVERIDAADANPDAATFVSATSGATVTVNHTTGAGRKVTLVEADKAMLIFDGVNDFATIVGDQRVMDFDPTVGLSLIVDVRMHNTTPLWGRVLTNTGASDDGAAIQRLSNNPRLYGRVDDGANVAIVGDNADNITYGVRTVAVAAFGSSAHEFYTAGVSRETETVAVAAEPAATLPFFGRRADGVLPLAFELHGFGVVKRRLSDSDVATITTELGF